MTMQQNKRILLAILDGWGLGQQPEADAIAQADTPTFDRLWEEYPHATLTTFGEEVGLPEGQMGNSEVGHLNIGAGRVVYQELARINKAVREGELARHEKLQAALAYAKKEQRAVHIMGLVSDGGVHAHINHLLGLCDIVTEQQVPQTYIHAFTDGRDCDPKSGVGFLRTLLQHIDQQLVQLASITGRYYAMDRDKRWERIKVAYDCLVHGQGEATQDPLLLVQQRYEAGETDEFLKPIVRTDDAGKPIGQIQTGDVLICFNFRPGRPREILEVLTQKDRPEQGMQRLDLYYLTMTRYDETFAGIEVLFEKPNISNTLGEILAKAGKTQLRMAETEKYPHVTFFFNGGQEKAFQGEKRIMINSPKVATYDLQPEMSAPEVTAALLEQMASYQPDFICINYANTDMVGHTGVFEAAKKAAKTVDDCLARVLEQAERTGYELLIIADHGNSDYLINADGSPNTAHSKNLVPLIFVSSDKSAIQLSSGKLGDIAPTILSRMGLDIPAEMDGEVLINEKTTTIEQ